MKGKSAPGLGPYAIVLFGLFVLSSLAVRTWQPVVDKRAREQQPLARLPKMIQPAVQQPSLAAAAERSQEQRPADRELRLLDRYAVERRPASSAPPVAAPAVIGSSVSRNNGLARDVPPPPEPPFAAPHIATRSRPGIEHYRAEPLPALPRQPMVSVDENQKLSAWPRAESLIAQFEALQQTPACAHWATDVLERLAELESAPSLGCGQAARTLAELDELVQPAAISVGLDQLDLRSQVLRARHALSRRLVIWHHVQTIVNQEPNWRVSIDPGNVSSALAEVDSVLKPKQAGPAWRDYLLVEHVRLIGSVRDVDPAARRELARRVLERLDAVYLSADQRDFLDQSAFTKLSEHMRRWSYEPLDYRQLLQRIEQLELGTTEYEWPIADDWRTLRWSPWQQTNELADVLNQYYRNANVRVAISAEMINRLLPDVQDIEEQVDDQILGTQVNGRSRIRTRLFVQLSPDPLRWRFGLVARGHVDSDTYAEKGVITFFSSGATFYRVRKLMTVDHRGVLFHRAEAIAENDSELKDVETAFDGLPLVGPMVRSLARRGHNERIGEANAEVEWKVGARVAQRMDDEVAQKVAEAEQRYRDRILQPLRKLQLNPVAIEMQTTDHRLIARYRVAADHQLAAYTPRPQAPGDSLLSIQIHETALNNFISQLHLDGRRLSARQLVAEMSKAMGNEEVKLPDEVEEDIVVQFAEHDAVRVAFQDGRIELTLNFAELRSGRDSWYDFAVRTSFAPSQSRDVQLVHDDRIELSDNIGIFDGRARLHVIFRAILNRYHCFSLLDKAILQNPKLSDVVLTQFVIRDGWVGIALGPGKRSVSLGPTSTTTKVQ